MVCILAVDTRAMSKAAVLWSRATTFIPSHKISRQMDMRQLAMPVEKHGRSFDGYKTVRRPIIVINRMAVWLDSFLQKVPSLAVLAKKVRA